MVTTTSARRSPIARLLAITFELDAVPTFAKQLPTFVLYMAAVSSSLLVPALIVSNLTALVLGGVLMLAVTALAAVITVRPELAHLALLVPAVDFVAIGVLRFATGEGQSIFASLVVLPILWVSSIAGRRFVIYAIAGAFTSVIVPVLLGAGIEVQGDELARAAFNPIAFGVAAFVVNELARQARREVQAAQLREQANITELKRAGAVQRALFPKHGSSLVGYDVAGACVPSKSVGGDFFDWYPVDGGLAFTLGDVMGKGVSAGMIAATARSVVRSAAEHPHAAEALRRLTTFLSTELGDDSMFVTLFHARVSIDGLVTFVDAGHGLTVHVRADGTAERLHSLDFPVGIDGEATWSERQLLLEHGDMLVSFSDGVLDLRDGTLGAVDEVAQIAAQSRSATEVVKALTEWATGQSNPDDVTVVALHRQPGAAPATASY